MPEITVFPNFISVQASKPSYSFGSGANIPIKNGTKEVLTRAGIPKSIPKGSVITSAVFRVAQNDNWSGSVTLGLHRNLTSWEASDSWNERPAAVASASGTDTQSGTSALNWWEIDVTDDVQGWLDRTIQYNWGWVLRTNSSTLHYVRGNKATSRHPHLVIAYEPPAKVPTNLSPAGGAVSVAKPVLTFDTSDNTTAIQVQIDVAADAVSPDFDSGEVTSTGGKLNLASTAYAGLADGATTYWRARAKSAAGWSAWSSWVSFSRNDLDTVTLTSPSATPADSTPPFAWTFGGTQAAWQADILYGTKVLRSSGRRSGADNDWTAEPLTGSYFGKTLTARVRVWDDVTRIATPGAPTYSQDTTDYVPAFTGTVDPMDSLTATQPTVDSPGILLTGTRVAGIPDEVAVFHDGELVARLDGADVFTSSTAFAFTDWWAKMGREVEISVVPIVDFEFADDAPTDTITPTCRGIWLVEPASGTAAVLWGETGGDWAHADVATEHLTIRGEVIRRRLANAPQSGSGDGEIFDVGALLAQDTLDAFETFRQLDASTLYRFIDGQKNLPVIAGNFLDYPTALEGGGEIMSRGHFDWWAKTEPVYVDGG